jgi:hypothetical protein
VFELRSLGFQGFIRIYGVLVFWGFMALEFQGFRVSGCSRGLRSQGFRVSRISWFPGSQESRGLQGLKNLVVSRVSRVSQGVRIFGVRSRMIECLGLRVLGSRFRFQDF